MALGKWLTGLGEPRKVNQLFYSMSGDQDPVGAMGKGVRKVEGLFRQAGMKNVTVKLYPGGRHEMLNEINRDEVFADTLAWLEQYV